MPLTHSVATDDDAIAEPHPKVCANHSQVRPESFAEALSTAAKRHALAAGKALAIHSHQEESQGQFAPTHLEDSLLDLAVLDLDLQLHNVPARRCTDEAW
jgi:hypothetical protein